VADPIVPPYFRPFVLPDLPREIVTGEPVMPDGIHALPEYEDVDWIGPKNQGGGRPPPEDYQWPSGPRERQEREGMG
jgi:hypothetical protein